MITLDTSGLVAVLNRRDEHHTSVRGVLERTPRPWFVPATILCETAYLLERRVGPLALDVLLQDLDRGEYTLDCGELDIVRIRTLVQRYADLPLGVVDASVIACAERRNGRVLTLDRRHFGVVACEGRLRLFPDSDSNG